MVKRRVLKCIQRALCSLLLPLRCRWSQYLLTLPIKFFNMCPESALECNLVATFALFTECCEICFSLPGQNFSLSTLLINTQTPIAYSKFVLQAGHQLTSMTMYKRQQIFAMCLENKAFSHFSTHSSSFSLHRIQIGGEVRQQEWEPATHNL